MESLHRHPVSIISYQDESIRKKSFCMYLPTKIDIRRLDGHAIQLIRRLLSPDYVFHREFRQTKDEDFYEMDRNQRIRSKALTLFFCNTDQIIGPPKCLFSRLFGKTKEESDNTLKVDKIMSGLKDAYFQGGYDNYHAESACWFVVSHKDESEARLKLVKSKIDEMTSITNRCIFLNTQSDLTKEELHNFRNMLAILIL